MSQPSILQYFPSKKRPAADEYKLENRQKLIKLDHDDAHAFSVFQSNSPVVSKCGANLKTSSVDREKTAPERGVTPPPRQNAKNTTDDLNSIKSLLRKSTKYSKLKESIAKFKKSAQQLQAVEKQIDDLAKSPNLKTFKSLEFEVTVSPQKIQSPDKSYLSPKKGVTPRKNLLSVLSPTKTSSAVTCDTSLLREVDDKTRTNLQLPFKYRAVTEMFRALDTVVQLLYNRKEIITFKKLKPAIEELIKRSFLTKHVAQIKSAYPDAYDYAQKKVKVYGTGSNQAEWELVLTPSVSAEIMTMQDLIDRRRHIHQVLIDKIKDYHNEFLLSLEPPIVVSKKDINHWHPEFDLEKVPEISASDLPQCPLQQIHTSGRQVLESARQLFSHNQRMNQALLNLKASGEKEPCQQPAELPTGSLIKGIPQALLEKVRQRQAAKALVSMTRTADREKEISKYHRLPEIARLVRNLFVTEKKVVLELGSVVDKLANSYQTRLSKVEMEEHLRTISSVVPNWLVFHNIRNCVYLKLAKNADLSVVVNKLESVAKQKSES